jgi:hypothetical protein
MELENTRINTLTKAHTILNFKDKDYREKNLPELFVQFICGLLIIKKNEVFYESTITSKEIRAFHDTIQFSFEDFLFFKAFNGKSKLNDTFFSNLTELSHNEKPLILITKDKKTCLVRNSCSGKHVKEKNGETNGNNSNENSSCDDVRHLLPLPSNHILSILLKERDRDIYNATFISFVKLCNDLFMAHDVFSKLKFDYFIWRELIQLFVKDNRMSVGLLQGSRNEVNFLS